MDLAGALLMRPGAAEGALRSTRRAWASSVSHGRAADELPGLLAAVYALCGGAHRLTAQAAVAAARGRPGPFEAGAPELLVRETLVEHLRRWWLDAPRLLPGDEGAAPSRLADGPALQGRADDHDPEARRRAAEALRRWAEQAVLGMSAAAWRDAWSADPRGCAQAWADDGRTWPARWTRAAREALQGLQQPLRAWPAPTPATLADLGDALGGGTGFEQAPTWRGQPAETGAWTRAADPGAGNPDLYAPLWMRAAARAADVARLLATPEEAPPPALACGAQTLGPRIGIAWCEMARGVLVHRVVLDADDRVQDCRVVAPTEWNAHPQGSWARLLAAAPADAPEAQLRWVAAMFDPCVECRIDARSPEHTHA